MSLRRVKLTQKPRGLRRHRRARRWPSIVIGLTGSIAMGKSTAANFFRHLRVPVFDADAAVHLLMGPKGKATKRIAARFPDVVGPQGVDRKALGAKVFGNLAALRDLEAIIHPLVKLDRLNFLRQAALRRAPMVVLDIPLLFEGKGEHMCDLVVVISAPAFLQRQRALARPAMTPERLAGILAQQWPDARKRRHAHTVIPSSLGKRETLRRLKQFLTLTRQRSSPTSLPG
jgi:dephospho-CoA kinase